MDLDLNQGTEVLQHRRKDSGLLVLTPSFRVLHMNQRAVEFMRRLRAFENQQMDEPWSNNPLPPSLLQFSTEFFDLAQERGDRDNREQFEIRSIINSRPEPIILRGFLLPDQNDWDHSRLVVLLYEIDA